METATWLRRRVDQGMGALFLGRLLRRQQGRAFFLNFMAEAEDSDERMVFDALLARVDDPELHKLVRLHRDDEVRHAQLLRGCVRRNGGEPARVAPELQVIRRVERAFGAFADLAIDSRRGIVEAYTFLQVVEERAVREFPRVAAALRTVDPDSAAIVDTIVRDEQRHVKYSIAVAKRYADESTRIRLLQRMRAAESCAAREQRQALVQAALAGGVLGVGSVEVLGWSLLARVS